MKKIAAIIIFAILGFSAFAQSQMTSMGKDAPASQWQSYEEALFQIGKLNHIEIDIPKDVWKKLLQNPEKKEYCCCSVTINAERFDNVGIRAKGASSLEDVFAMKSDRYSFVVKLNKYVKGQKYHGLSKLMLNNNIGDATQMKDVIAYDMSRYLGLPTPLCNYATITLNGKYFGCYLVVEPVDKNFCKRNYPFAPTNLYKPYHNLTYSGDNIADYAGIGDEAKINGSEESLRNVIKALKSVATGIDIEKYVDVDNVLKYMALQTMVVNFDGLTGGNEHNYFLRESDGRINLIPWDYNLAWGGYQDDGGEEEGDEEFEDFATYIAERERYLASLSAEQLDSVRNAEKELNFQEGVKVVNFPIDIPFSCNIEKCTFFMNLLNNKDYKAAYYKYLKMLCVDYVQNGVFERTVSTVKQEIGGFAGKEANAFYNNGQFHEAVQMLEKVLDKRALSVLGQINGTIPSTWEAQDLENQKLIDCTDIDLSKMGNCGDFE